MPKSEKDLWVEMAIREISTQSHFAEIAYANINPKAANGNDVVFSSIHSFLSHCAMVSKMLRAKDEIGKAIGEVLNIPDDSVIHKRRFRNHLEHYDERMKRWIGRFAAGSNIGTYNIGPKAAIRGSGLPTGNNIILVSHYDPGTTEFTFVDEDFNLSELKTEASRIKALADRWVTLNC